MTMTLEPEPHVSGKSIGALITDFMMDELRGSNNGFDHLTTAQQDFMTAKNPSPAKAVDGLLEYAKKMLPRLQGSNDQRRGLDALLRWRDVGIAVVVKSRGLGRDVEMPAQELTRRLERRTAQLVRQGQEAGIINARQRSGLRQVGEFFVGGDGERTDGYIMAEVSDEKFEQAMDAARKEGNFARVNVIRLIRGEDAPVDRKLTETQREELIRVMAQASMTSEQIAQKMGRSAGYVRIQARHFGIEITADKVVGLGGAGFDPVRIVNETVHTLDGLAFGLRLLGDEPVADLFTPEQRVEMAASLAASTRIINRLTKQLRKDIES